MTEDSIRVTAGRPAASGTDTRARGGLPVPTELLVFALVAVAVLIAAAVDDGFSAPVAWGFVTLLAFAYILSRGIAKR